jgi:hypothetical protein
MERDISPRRKDDEYWKEVICISNLSQQRQEAIICVSSVVKPSEENIQGLFCKFNV